MKCFRQLIAPHGPEALPMELPNNLLFHWKSGVGPDEELLLHMAAQLGGDLCIFGIDPLVLVDHRSFGIASTAGCALRSFAALRGAVQELVLTLHPPISARLVDRILDRINEVGLAGLHPIERKTLDRHAQQG